MQSNREIITSIFEEAGRGNGRLFAEAMADDIEWRIIGATSWSGVFRGKTQVLRELLGTLRDRLGGSNICRPTRVLADGEFVVVQARGENSTASGRDYRNDYCFVIRMSAGRIVSVEEYSDTELIASALGPGPHATA